MKVVLVLLFLWVDRLFESTPFHQDPQKQERKRAAEFKENPLIEIAIFADSFLWQHALAVFGSESAADDGLKNYVRAIVSEGQALYHHPSMKPSIDFRIVHYEVWKQWPDEMCDDCIDKFSESRANPYKMLDIFAKMQRSGKWDAAFLMTGIKDLDGVAGLAFVSGICSAEYRASIISTSASPADLPHELGHLLNMNHDDDLDISKASDEQAKRSYVWSAYRIVHLNKLLAERDEEGTNCLRTLAYPKKPVLELTENPSELYPPELQCKWNGVNGSPHRENQKEWCSGVWCATSDLSWQSIPPAIYRTPCGGTNYCAMSMDWSEGGSRCVDSATEFSVLDKFNYAYGDCRGGNVDIISSWWSWFVNSPGWSDHTLEECAKLCDRLSECKAFVFRDGKCFPKRHYCGLELTDTHDQSIQFFLKDV